MPRAVDGSRRNRVCALALVLTLASGSGCRAVGHGANAAFEWGGRTFTTNPVSVAPYVIGFVAFFLAALPLDLVSAVATLIGWPDGKGEDYQGSMLAPSIYMGVGGGTILAAPFFPFGLPWWEPERADDEPVHHKKPPAPAAPAREEPPSDADLIPAGAPPRR